VDILPCGIPTLVTGARPVAGLVVASFLVRASGLLVRGNSSDDGTSNICVSGRTAPELILLGPGRSSTTLFAMNIIRSPSVVLGQCLEEGKHSREAEDKCPRYGIKEMRFYNSWTGDPKGVRQYLAHYPKCQTSTRLVSADLTPVNYGAITGVPKIYGQEMFKVKFVSLLRNPTKCLQSYYYYMSQDAKQSFQQYAQTLVTTGEGGFVFSDVLYAPHLRDFFTTFSPAQLHVCPMKYNVVEWNGRPRFPVYIWGMLGVPPPGPDAMIEEMRNNSLYPPIEEDLQFELLASLENYVYGITGPGIVAQLLAEHSPSLYGYTGASGDVVAIEAWIRDGW